MVNFILNQAELCDTNYRKKLIGRVDTVWIQYDRIKATFGIMSTAVKQKSLKQYSTVTPVLGAVRKLSNTLENSVSLDTLI